MSQQAEPWPIDFDLLQKGDSIAVERIEQWAELPRTDARYPLKLLAMRDVVERKCRERGLLVTVKAEHGSLRILLDPEASEWNDKRERSLLGQFARTHQRLNAVDVGQLGDGDRELHERRLTVSGTFMAAFIGAKKKLVELLPHKRKTPGLPADAK